jgi:hypothetical protein
MDGEPPSDNPKRVIKFIPDLEPWNRRNKHNRMLRSQQVAGWSSIEDSNMHTGNGFEYESSDRWSEILWPGLCTQTQKTIV